LIDLIAKGVAMSQRALATGLAFALAMFIVGVASAQVPFFGVYFDQGHSVEALPPPPCGNPCPGFGIPGDLYIALVNANAYVSGVEFAVSYPPEIIWLADVDKQPVTIGTTPVGFSMGWALPQNGFHPVSVCRVNFLWNCDRCLRPDIPIVVVTHPYTGFLGYTDYPQYNMHPAVGLTSLICACVPAEETTWGKLKSLYVE
jgi:hypothetical protein